MRKFAVIDTETTWNDKVMSIGIAIAESETFELISTRYYVLTPFKSHPAMYSDALYVNGVKPDLEDSRKKVVKDLRVFLSSNEISEIFAYNASFDKRHMPELSGYSWFDIIRLAAYRQHNRKIPRSAECWSTGRLKTGYGVGDIYRLLSKDMKYYELHNALTDAVDELEIMKMLDQRIDKYVEI